MAETLTGTPTEAEPETPTHGYTENKAAHQRRLRRIEGQIRGLERMIDEDAYCIDVLVQVSAATRALQGVALSLLDEHVHHCVRHAIAAGEDGDEKIAEALAAVERLVKS
jgi:CsoR family transcriptional regulator, copper-sensing transcriptional repressor